MFNKNTIPFNAVKVGLYEYNIKEASNFTDSTIPDSIGECDFVIKQITIHSYLPLQQLQQTMMHEIVHAVAHTFNIPLPVPEDEMERVVDSMATGILMVLKDNPEMVKWLLKKK
nr:MAG TPA: Protein of unknown function (DUF3920) [Caudoviricetes sp.]